MRTGADPSCLLCELRSSHGHQTGLEDIHEEQTDGSPGHLDDLEARLRHRDWLTSVL